MAGSDLWDLSRLFHDKANRLMTAWNCACIKFQYSPLGKRDYRLISQITTQVYRKPESAPMAQPRTLYGSTWQDFVSLELEWR